MEALRQDPKAMEIFIDELALADKTQPKHLRFLANLPQYSSPSERSARQRRNSGNLREQQAIAS